MLVQVVRISAQNHPFHPQALHPVFPKTDCTLYNYQTQLRSTYINHKLYPFSSSLEVPLIGNAKNIYRLHTAYSILKHTLWPGQNPARTL